MKNSIFDNFEEYKMMKISIHNKIIGKPEKKQEPDGRFSLWMGDEKINLGYGWLNQDVSWPELFIMLADDGFAIAPYIKGNGHRIKENFISHSIALVDIDSGMRLDELKDNLFYQGFGSGYYTTPSHTEENHRFRLMFVLETPITDTEKMRNLYEGLLLEFGHADISCKDAARLFFGTINSTHNEITDKVLTDDAVDYIISERLKLNIKKDIAIDNNYKPMQHNEMIEILDKLKTCYADFSYHDRFSITRAVASVIGVSAAIQEMRIRWNDGQKSAKYEQLLKDPLISGGPSAGSLIEWIRKVDPLYRKRTVVLQKPVIVTGNVKEKLSQNRIIKKGTL
jgi:hypothetical protein